MKSGVYCFVLLLVSSLVGCQGGTKEKPSEQPAELGFGDASPAKTPQDAMRIYFQGMIDNDTEAMKSVVVPFERIDELFEVQAKLNQAMKGFNQAGAARFPNVGGMFDSPTAAEQQLEVAGLAEVISDDDTHAHCQLSRTGPPLQLVAEEGSWKLDLSSSPEFRDSISTQIGTFGDTVKLFEGMTRDLNSGKIDSIQMLQSEMKKRRIALNL